MKLPKSIETRSEWWDFASTIAYGLFIGGAVASLLPNWGYLVFGALAVLFGVLNWRTGFASSKTRAADKLDAMRYRGEYPPSGQGRDDDVKRLKEAGQRVFATQLFRELHGGTLREAIDAIDAM